MEDAHLASWQHQQDLQLKVALPPLPSSIDFSGHQLTGIRGSVEQSHTKHANPQSHH